MDFRILGPLEALAEGRDVAPAGTKQRALLALLLLHANETLPVERLIDELWGEDPPPTAARTVQAHVSRLRKALRAGGGKSADALIVTREHGYQLRLDPERLDSHRFERLLAEGRSELAMGDPKRAAAALEQALSLWRGTPLVDLVDEPFVQREAGRLEDLRVVGMEDLGEAKLALGRHGELVGRLEALIGEHPYRERLRAQLMLALYRCERQADALQAYQDARRTLIEELGIEPGERLRELERAVLAQDPGLAAPSAPPGVGDGERDGGDLPTGVVTFLLTDIEGSSGLWEADADAMAAALELHDELIAQIVNEYGGWLLKAKGEGDATLTVFRRASDAVACAVVLERTLHGAAWRGGLDLRVRVALHTGEAQERGGDYFGPALNRAARLRSVARGGATVMSQATAEIVHDRLPPETGLVELGRQELRGLSRPENVFELRATSQAATPRPAEPAAAAVVGNRRPPLPPLLWARRAPALVGRRRVLEVLGRSFSDASAGRCRVVLLTGEPGIGKTSVAAELARRAHEAQGALVLYGAADEEPLIAYQPFVEALRDWVTHVSLEELRVRAEVVGADLARLVPELRQRLPGLPDPLEADPDTERYRLFRAVASLLGELSRSAPVLLVLDDLQWADESSLLLLKHVARSSTETALLVVGACRDPDPRSAGALAELIADLRRDRLLERLSLTGLSEEEVAALVSERGGDDAPARLGQLLRHETEGNPFFIGEVWLHLAESELGARPEAWVDALESGKVGVPVGVKEVTARRLGRLDERSRRVLELASVIGVDFGFDLVERLSGAPDAQLVEALDEAVAAQLVRELPGEVGSYAFSHTLTRAAVYEGLPSVHRARLHGRVGEALEELHAADIEPHLGELAFHFLAAGGGEADKAVDYSQRAGERASRQLAYAEAAGHYERALEALERAGRVDQPPGRELLERLVEIGDVLAQVGELGRAERLLGRAAAAAAGRQRDLELHALVERDLVRFSTGTGTGVDEHARLAKEAIAELDALGHDLGLASAWFLLGMVPWMHCRHGDARQAFEQARAHARAVGNRRKEAQILEYLAASHLFGPTPASEAIVTCERMLAEATGGPSYEILFALAGLRAMRGEFDTARELVRRSQRTLDELGLTLESARTGEMGGLIELLAGDPAAAERELRPGFELLSEAGDRNLLSSRAAELADALYLQERYEEAERLTQTSEHLADPDDVHPRVRWRAVRAKTLVHRGALEQAERLAREAVALSADTDSVDHLQAGSRMDLAQVLILAGRPAEAVAPAREALELYGRKENTVMAAQARALLRELAGTAAPGRVH
jgi:DNA-binding SARP family transcriptional activator